jgi:hypothetical protein
MTGPIKGLSVYSAIGLVDESGKMISHYSESEKNLLLCHGVIWKQVADAATRNAEECWSTKACDKAEYEVHGWKWHWPHEASATIRDLTHRHWARMSQAMKKQKIDRMTPYTRDSFRRLLTMDRPTMARNLILGRRGWLTEPLQHGRCEIRSKGQLRWKMPSDIDLIDQQSQ